VARDAMDAAVSQDVRRSRVRSSRVVLIPRRWDQANRDDLFATEANKPGLRGERGAAVKPLRRECRAISALPDDLWAFSFSAHEDCGCG
jgi:hypothetical protein